MDIRQPLGDVTNVVSPGPLQKIIRKRKADGTYGTYVTARKIRKSMDIPFSSELEKQQFDDKLCSAKQLLQCKTNEELINKMLDIVLMKDRSSYSSLGVMLEKTPENFICSKSKIVELVDILKDTQSDIVNFNQNGHVANICLQDRNTHMFYTWNSSDRMKDDFVINYKMFHAHISSGMLTAQYEKLCDNASIGVPSTYFREKALPAYAKAIDRLSKISMNAALEVEQTHDEEGLSHITDARHACRKNSFHTDVVCIGYNTHRVINYVHVTKAEEACSQKHEACGTRTLYQDFNTRGIRVRSLQFTIHLSNILITSEN